MKKHGVVVNGWLKKSGKYIVKFWKHNAYAIAESDLEGVVGVILYTPYDGILYQTTENIKLKGTPNDFNGEKQIVLPVEDWLKKDGDN